MSTPARPVGSPSAAIFAARGSHHEIEEGLSFAPKFDDAGVLAAVATDVDSGDVLMLAWMNAEALSLTIQSGYAHFYSRSRGRLWKKGEESGNLLEVIELRTDCDQDAVWLKVRVAGSGAACHTGRKSCFYRAVRLPAASGGMAILHSVGGGPLFDPGAVYSPKADPEPK